MKVLVLGATGFIGGHIARAAIEAGWQVSGLRRTAGTTGHLQGVRLQWIQGNLEDPESLEKAMQGMDLVFHAAAYYPRRRDRSSVATHIERGVRQTTNVLTCARSAGISRLVYTSTLTTIGRPPQGAGRLANEDDFYQPGSQAKSAYTEAKFAMEQAVIDAAQDGLPAVILNPTAVFGPGDVHLTLSSLLIAVARGWAIAWLPAVINVIDVRDVAQAHIQAARLGKPGERYILGGYNFSLKETLDLATGIAGVKPPRVKIPLWLVDGLIRIDDLLPFVNLSGNHLRGIRNWQGYDTTKAKTELALMPRPFNETVKEALIWLRANGHLP